MTKTSSNSWESIGVLDENTCSILDGTETNNIQHTTNNRTDFGIDESWSDWSSPPTPPLPTITALPTTTTARPSVATTTRLRPRRPCVGVGLVGFAKLTSTSIKRKRTADDDDLAERDLEERELQPRLKLRKMDGPTNSPSVVVICSIEPTGSSSCTEVSSNPNLVGMNVRTDPLGPEPIGPAKDLGHYSASSAYSGCEISTHENVNSTDTVITSSSDELASMMQNWLSLKD